MKKFRINVGIIYFYQENIKSFRPLIGAVFYNLAWLYQIDFSIVEDYKIEGASDGHETDMIFLRSNEGTLIDRKELRDLIGQIFQKSHLFRCGVDGFWQPQSVYKKFPFPSEYFHPLSYPYMQDCKDNRKSLCVSEASLKEVLEDYTDEGFSYN